MSKGSKRRPTDEPAFRKGWEGVFGLMRQDVKQPAGKPKKGAGKRKKVGDK